VIEHNMEFSPIRGNKYIFQPHAFFSSTDWNKAPIRREQIIILKFMQQFWRLGRWTLFPGTNRFFMTACDDIDQEVKIGKYFFLGRTGFCVKDRTLFLDLRRQPLFFFSRDERVFLRKQDRRLMGICSDTNLLGRTGLFIHKRETLQD